MKKGVSLTLILILLVTTLIGCGGATDTDTTNEQEPINVESSDTEAAPEEEAEEPKEEVVYEDGVYEGEAEGMHHLKVSVEVVDGKIAKVNILEQEETSGIADPALEQIPITIVEKNSPNVDTISGATFTSNGIMDAVKNALEDAK